MIWLWTPGIDGLNNVHIPDEIEFPLDVDEAIIDPVTTRIYCKLRNPDYIEDIDKPYKVLTKRSMSDRIRTYVTYDHRNVDHLQQTLRFEGVTTNRIAAIKQFLQNSEGQNIGYKSPDGRYFSATIMNPEAVLTMYHPGHDNWLEDGTMVVSEWGSLDIQILLIKEGFPS